MKTIRFLMLFLLATVAVSVFGQCPPGRTQSTSPFITNPSSSDLISSGGSSPASGPGYAEAITPDIQALANGLQDNPVKIFKYVHDHIKFVLYYGSMKGAELTLLEQSGNDFDQSSLLVALLQAAGYSPTYEYSLVWLPYQATDGTQNDLQHWWGMTMPYTNSTAIYNYVGTVLGQRGYDLLDFNSANNDRFGVQHTWVSVTVGGTNYQLDPAFKVSVPVSGITNLAAAMGLSSNALMAAAGGTDTGTYCSGLNEANLRNTLTSYTTNLLNYLQSNYPNASVEQILGGSQIVPYTNADLSEAIAFNNSDLDDPGGGYPELTWTNLPTAFMSGLSMTISSITNQIWYFPQFEGQGLSLDFDSGGTARLYIGNSNVLQSSTGSGSTVGVTLNAFHPYGPWNAANNTPTDGGNYDGTATKSYQRQNASYAIMYGFEPSVKWLNAQEQQLDIYQSEGYSNTSPQIVNATLNVMGMEWMVQTKLALDILCQEDNLLPEFHHRIGRMAEETGNGYYVDVYMQKDETVPSTGEGAADLFNQYTVFDVSSYIWSAMEHGMIQQLQDSNLVAASTVRFLQLANTNLEDVFLANNSNWSTVAPQLYNYGTLTNTLSSLISAGYSLLLPANGAIPVAGSGSYTGDGYVELLSTSTNRVSGMIIGGSYSGGYVSDINAFINPDYTELSVINQPSYFTTTPVYTPAPPTADPIDTADGTFQVENTDLSLGQAEPQGMTLSRYYNGTRRFSSVGGMTGGWVHNYCITANNIAAPQAGLGSTTPAQMASMLVATYAGLSLYNYTQPDPKNWMVTALIGKWSVDQLIQNGVSVNLGKDTLQFIRQPNGVFTPPANCTSTLIQTNSAYVMQMRHGNTFMFNSAGNLTNIVDQYSNSLTLTYNTSNWVNTVKDWKGRTLNFNYTGTPAQLTSVSDGSRTVYYNYSIAYNSQGDLASYVDPEGKTNIYTYDGNHEITGTSDGLNRLVVSNLYDGDGHVFRQYTEGLTNKEWQIFWSGWQTISEDPAGGQTTYFYDDLGRLTGTEDALGNLTQSAYDGQNHIVETISPLNETNLSFYDGNNNVTQTVDALDFTNRSIYDANNSLIKTIDPRGNPTTYGYNAEFSLIGQTNGANDYVNYTYNPIGSSYPGTLASRTDSSGTANYGYDSTYGQLISVAYSGISTNTFVNSALGDVITQVDARGFSTLFQYNNRRELTNTIAPTNLTTSVSYDAADNVIGNTDARRNTTSQTWSATKHVLSTTLPSMPQGAPIVTNIYDNRDWLTGTIDALQNQSAISNDLDGRKVLLTDPLQRTTTFGYDADGRQLAMTNGSGEATHQTWDAKGELIALIDGAGHTSTRVYDPAGNQVTLTNRNNNAWHFYFDGANRLTNTVSPLGRKTSVVFNHQGLPSFVTDGKNQTTTNFYDSKGRLTNRADLVASTFYGYDANDNRTSIVENGHTNAWTYDAYNRVSTYTDANGYLMQYRYDANGNLTNLVYPGNKNVYYAYDSNNHLTNVADWSQRVTSITYDLDGQLSTITRPNGTFRTINYDQAGQITNIQEQMANTLPIALMRFAWNSNSTMQWEFLAPQPHTNLPPTRTMTYDADNELATVDGYNVAMDNDGNLTSGPLTNDTAFTYAYDARNRLQNVGGLTNFYDAANNRTGQTYGTNSITYVINPNSKLSQVLMRIKNGVTNYYIYGPGLLYQITEAPTGTNTVTYHYDSRGSTIALTGDNGLVTDRMEYSLYATMTYHLGTNDTPFLFNGQFGVMTDPNGLLSMRARYYSTFLCRFLNPDPSGFSAGMNFYAYANGNPAGMTDPTGLDAGNYQTSSWINNQGSWSVYNSLPAAPANVANPFDITPTFNPAVDFNPNVYQPTEPSTTSIFALGLSVFGAGEALQALNSTRSAASLQLSSGAQQTLAGTQNGVLLGTIEGDGTVNLFESSAGQIEGHADLLDQGLASQNAQGFSIGAQNGQVTWLRSVSTLNSENLNYNLSSDAVGQLQNIFQVSDQAVFSNP
jgi:RHS repeat-associated protein